MPRVTQNGQRREKLAINVFDLDRIDPDFRRKILAERLDLTHHIDMRFDRIKEADEAAVEFTCDLLTAAIICDILRSHDREVGDFPTRLYLKRESWSRIPSRVVLTVTEHGKVKLNPKLFPTEVRPSELVPPPTTTLQLD